MANDDEGAESESSRFSLEHRLRQARQPHQERRPPIPKRRIALDAGLIVAIGIVISVLIPLGDVPNPDYPQARAIADRLEATWAAAQGEGASLVGLAESAGLRVHELDANGAVMTVITDPTPTDAGVCYGLRGGGGFTTSALRFSPTDGCTLADRSQFDAVGPWGSVLPSERMTPGWFVPVVLVLVGAGLALTTDIVLKIVNR